MEVTSKRLGSLPIHKFSPWIWYYPRPFSSDHRTPIGNDWL